MKLDIYKEISEPVRQSGVIPFRIEKGDIKVMIITSINKGRWIVPKGFVEPFQTPLESAVKEAMEEAGVSGRSYEEVAGEYRYEKQGTKFVVSLFLMEIDTVHESWLEAASRSRKLVSVKKAREMIYHPALKKVMKKLPAIIKKIRKGLK